MEENWKVTMVLAVSPLDDALSDDLTEAATWDAYVSEVLGLIDAILRESTEKGPIRLGEVLVPRSRDSAWSPSEFGWTVLRNGLTATEVQARTLVRRMLSGDGPYACLWQSDGFRVEPGWDASLRIHVPLSLQQAIEARLGELSETSVLVEMAREDLRWESVVFDAARYDAFFSELLEATKNNQYLVLAERWAYGYKSDRWWAITAENVDAVISSVLPCSLLSLFVCPQFSGQALVEDVAEFVAFKRIHGVEPLDVAHFSDLGEGYDLVQGGYVCVMSAETSASTCVVVPDESGVFRADWDSLFV